MVGLIVVILGSKLRTLAKAKPGLKSAASADGGIVSGALIYMHREYEGRGKMKAYLRGDCENKVFIWIKHLFTIND